MQTREKWTINRTRWGTGEEPLWALLISDIKEEELKSGHMQMEKWSIFSDIFKYVQYNQYPIGHFKLEVKAPDDRYGTKIYKKSYRIVEERSRK